MALSISKIALAQAIQQAFNTINSAGAADGSDPQANIQALASALATAIHTYVSSAQVDITQVVSIATPGIAVATAGSPFAQTGATVSPGPITHAGFGQLI